MSPNRHFIKDLLEQKVFEYNRIEFIADDPVSVPHAFSSREDIEISAFLTAMISWGQRKTIIRNAKVLMEWMDSSPYDFVINASDKDLKQVELFRHRTFNGTDCQFFIRSLQHIYHHYGSLEKAFDITGEPGIKIRIRQFRDIFFSVPGPARSGKHIADPSKGSSAKRINMFLRWMVRQDNSGVDFGLWNSMTPSMLCCPLDVHSGNVARKLGLLTLKQNNWQAVEELTEKLRIFDPEDPVKYDYALFGLGIYEKF